ncbi:hypothetical protein CR513_24174, partial [Mucuna pruriens]
MATLGSKPRFVLIVLPLLLLLSLMCQEIVATDRLRSKEGCTSTGIACHAKVLEMNEYDQAYVSPPHDDYDYDFYRKHGDIPSPGADGLMIMCCDGFGDQPIYWSTPYRERSLLYMDCGSFFQIAKISTDEMFIGRKNGHTPYAELEYPYNW